MSADDEIQDSSAPLIEHLAELRQRLIYSFVAFIIGMIICFTIWNPIFDFLTHPLCSAMALRGHSDCGLILIKLQEGFFALNQGNPILASALFKFVLQIDPKNERANLGMARTNSFDKVQSLIIQAKEFEELGQDKAALRTCLLYTSPSPRD